MAAGSIRALCTVARVVLGDVGDNTVDDIGLVDVEGCAMVLGGVVPVVVVLEVVAGNSAGLSGSRSGSGSAAGRNPPTWCRLR